MRFRPEIKKNIKKEKRKKSLSRFALVRLSKVLCNDGTMGEVFKVYGLTFKRLQAYF